MATNNITYKHIINSPMHKLVFSDNENVTHWHDLYCNIMNTQNEYCNDYDENIGVLYFTWDQLPQDVQSLLQKSTPTLRDPLPNNIYTPTWENALYTISYECFCANDPYANSEIR